MTQINKLLASLCYFSLFFAPFLFPLIIYFVIGEDEVKHHAKSSLLSHILPIISVPILIIVAFQGEMIVLPALLFGIVILVMTIWNIYRGIKVLLK